MRWTWINNWVSYSPTSKAPLTYYWLTSSWDSNVLTSPKFFSFHLQFGFRKIPIPPVTYPGRYTNGVQGSIISPTPLVLYMSPVLYFSSLMISPFTILTANSVRFRRSSGKTPVLSMSCWGEGELELGPDMCQFCLFSKKTPIRRTPGKQL